jgi:hypothetical protein
MEIIVNEDAVRIMRSLRENAKKDQLPVVVLYSEVKRM